MKKSQLTGRYIAPTSYGPQSGTGFFDWISKARNAIVGTNNFLKNSRAISKVSGVAGDLFGNQNLKNFSSFAAKHGYGEMAGMPVACMPKKRKTGGKKGGKKKAKK